MSKELSDRYTKLLQDNYIVQTYVDANNCRGLPHHLTGGQRLDIGLNMAVNVDPLQVNELGIIAGLSFNRKVHTVYIPWFAVMGCRVEGNDQELLRSPETDDIVTSAPPEPVGAFPQQFADRVHDMLHQDKEHNSNDQKVIRVDFANRKKM